MATQCGCISCKGKDAPTTRAGWKGLKNKKGYPIGMHLKPRKAKPRRIK